MKYENPRLSANKYCYNYFDSVTYSFIEGEEELKHKPDNGIIEAGVY